MPCSSLYIKTYLYLEAVFCVSLLVSMTFRVRNVFLELLLVKKIFFIILDPKNVKNDMSPIEDLSFVLVYLTLYFFILLFILIQL